MGFYDLTFTDSRGNIRSMKDYRGKVVLIVNTTTKCGLAPQFTELEQLHQRYQSRGLIVLGFPCDQFLHQEPESDGTMAATCKLNFGVTFPLSKKIMVNGKETHPVFAYLKKNTPGGLFGKGIKWNFTKFLVTDKGLPYKRYAPTVRPSDMGNDIERLLEQK